jgi:hypothetical protein
MNIFLGVISILSGILFLIRIKLKPYEKSPWLFNTKGVAIAIGLFIIGIILLNE